MPNSPMRGEEVRLPTPDPTPRTTEQLLRMIESLKELVFVRLDAMDKAMDLFRKHLTEFPTELDKQLANRKELVQETFKIHEQKFANIATQFSDRDVALSAALQSQKEAVAEQNKSSAMAIAKSETATTKQIDQIGALLSNAVKTSDEKIDDLKQRLTLVEGRTIGAGLGTERAEKRSNDNWGWFFGLAMAVIAVVAILVEVLKFAR